MLISMAAPSVIPRDCKRMVRRQARFRYTLRKFLDEGGNQDATRMAKRFLRHPLIRKYVPLACSRN